MTSSDLREEISSIIQTTLNEAESRWQAKQDAWQAKQDAREAALSRWHTELKAMFASLGAHIAKGPTGTSSMAAPNPDSSNEAWNNYLASSDPREQIGPYEPRDKNRKSKLKTAASNISFFSFKEQSMVFPSSSNQSAAVVPPPS